MALALIDRGVTQLRGGSGAAALHGGMENGTMNELLNLAVKAHGGLERWNKIKSIRMEGSITGAVWYLKNKPDYLKNIVMTVDARNERVVTEFVGQDKRTIFEAEKVVIEKMDGTIVENCDYPESSFDGHQRGTPWNDVHVAYFSGEAMWTYLTTPFLYTYEGFETEEIAPIREENETWRRLNVRFPDYVKSHTREQISCFGPDGLLRRHDYTVDLLAKAPGLNYALDYRNVDGIMVPMTRRIYCWQGDYQVVKDPLLVAIDMKEVKFA